jgi:hypothetical protein
MVIVLVAASLVAACHKSKSYTANVEVTRLAPVRKDENGSPVTLDFEFTYFECPGTQVEVIRGGKDFAACVSKYAVGTKVPIAIEHVWSDEGHYKWNVTKVGDCTRVQDPADEASYAMIRECADWKVNDQRVGFQCKYVPEKALIDKCPWFKRR